LHLHSETELLIQVKELLFDNAYLSKVIDDKKSWFTRMEVLDLIYDQFFFTANTLGHQPSSTQYFQPLTPQTLALAAAAIRYGLFEYDSRKKCTVILSHDAYLGTFCQCPVINFTPEATALINCTLLGHLIPSLWPNSARIGTPQTLLALLSLD